MADDIASHILWFATKYNIPPNEAAVFFADGICVGKKAERARAAEEVVKAHEKQAVVIGRRSPRPCGAQPTDGKHDPSLSPLGLAAVPDGRGSDGDRSLQAEKEALKRRIREIGSLEQPTINRAIQRARLAEKRRAGMQAIAENVSRGTFHADDVSEKHTSHL
jgi:hypothetical protein